MSYTELADTAALTTPAVGNDVQSQAPVTQTPETSNAPQVPQEPVKPQRIELRDANGNVYKAYDSVDAIVAAVSEQDRYIQQLHSTIRQPQQVPAQPQVPSDPWESRRSEIVSELTNRYGPAANVEPLADVQIKSEQHVVNMLRNEIRTNTIMAELANPENAELVSDFGRQVYDKYQPNSIEAHKALVLYERQKLAPQNGNVKPAVSPQVRDMFANTIAARQAQVSQPVITGPPNGQSQVPPDLQFAIKNALAYLPENIDDKRREMVVRAATEKYYERKQAEGAIR